MYAFVPEKPPLLPSVFLLSHLSVCDGLFTRLFTSPSNLNVSITREDKMDKPTVLDKDKIIPERMAVLRSLPVEIKQLLTGEEAQAFLYGEELPEDLAEKLKDYLIQE